jgi:hypothetical protein
MNRKPPLSPLHARSKQGKKNFAATLYFGFAEFARAC